MPSEVKQLVAHIASKTAGSRYCQAHTIYGISRTDIDEARLAAIWDYGSSPLYNKINGNPLNCPKPRSKVTRESPDARAKAAR